MLRYYGLVAKCAIRAWVVVIICQFLVIAAMKCVQIKKAMIVFLCTATTVAFARGVGAVAGGRSHSSHADGGSSNYSGEHYVHGYTSSDGRYVQGHFQTNPNGTQRDNWSTKGNVNPHTGQVGTKDPTH